MHHAYFSTCAMIDNNGHIRFCLFRATQHPEPKIDEKVLKGWLNPPFKDGFAHLDGHLWKNVRIKTRILGNE